MPTILLAGTDAALLEGLSQLLSTLAYRCEVAHTLAEARTLASQELPLLVVVGRELVEAAPAEALALPLAPGGALVTFRAVGSLATAYPPALHRLILAELTLPLERNRLAALAQSVQERVRSTGRALPSTAATPSAGHGVTPSGHE